MCLQSAACSRRLDLETDLEIFANSCCNNSCYDDLRRHAFLKAFFFLFLCLEGWGGKYGIAQCFIRE